MAYSYDSIPPLLYLSPMWTVPKICRSSLLSLFLKTMSKFKPNVRDMPIKPLLARGHPRPLQVLKSSYFFLLDRAPANNDTYQMTQS